MTVYICGDSFGFSDPEYGPNWADHLSRRLPVVNLCRVAASNFQIALQVQRAIEQGADYIIYLATSSVRQDVSLHDSADALLDRYGKSVVSYSVSSLDQTAPFDREQLSLLKSYHDKFFDLDMSVHQNELIIEATLSRLVASGIPFTFDQGGFEHPKFAGSKTNYFKTYRAYRSDMCLWDYVDEKLIHRPYYHITDHAIHKEITEYYYKLINDKT